MMTLPQIEAALAAYEQDLRSRVDTARKGALPEALRLFKTEKDQYEAADKARKAIGELIESLSRATIPEMMEEQGVKTTTITYDEGVNYRFTVAQRASCSMSDKEAGIQWLKDQGHGGMVQETVNAGTLAAFAKDYIATEGKDLPTEMFKFSMMAYTSITKA